MLPICGSTPISHRLRQLVHHLEVWLLPLTHLCHIGPKRTWRSLRSILKPAHLFRILLFLLIFLHHLFFTLLLGFIKDSKSTFPFILCQLLLAWLIISIASLAIWILFLRGRFNLWRILSHLLLFPHNPNILLGFNKSAIQRMIAKENALALPSIWLVRPACQLLFL